MSPEAARQEAYAHAFICFDDYIQKLRHPGSQEQREFAAILPEACSSRLITDACLRLAHHLHRQSNLAAAGIGPDYPDPPPEADEPSPPDQNGVRTVALLADGTALYDLQRWYENHLPPHDLMAELRAQGYRLQPFSQLDSWQLESLAELIEYFPNDPDHFEPQFRHEYEPDTAAALAELLGQSDLLYLEESDGPVLERTP